MYWRKFAIVASLVCSFKKSSLLSFFHRELGSTLSSAGEEDLSSGRTLGTHQKAVGGGSLALTWLIGSF